MKRETVVLIILAAASIFFGVKWIEEREQRIAIECMCLQQYDEPVESPVQGL